MASKDILWEGRWTYPGGRVLNVRTKELENAMNQGNRMLKSGLPLPWCWDHQPGVAPVPVQMSASVLGDPDTRAAVAKNTIPLDTKALRIEERDHRGHKRKVLVADFDDSKLSPTEKAQVQAAGKVSCRLVTDFHDARGNGRIYGGLSVCHIAVTPKAVEPNQGPFVMSSSVPEIERGKWGEMWDMAFGKEEGEDDTGEYETAGGEPDGDEVAGETTGDGEEADPLADVEGPAMPAPVVPAPAAPIPAGPLPEMSAILTSLNTLGLPLSPDDVTDVKSLALALKIMATAGLQAKNTAQNDPDSDLSNTVGAGASPPIMMSQSAMLAKAPDTVARDRDNVKAKIQRLHNRGKIPGPTYDLLLQEFGAFEMSYAAGSGRLQQTGLIRDLQTLDRLLPARIFGGRTAGDTYEMGTSGIDPAQVAAVNPPAQFASRSGTGDLETMMAESMKRHSKPGATA